MQSHNHRSISTAHLKQRRDELVYAETSQWSADEELWRVLELEAISAELAERGEDTRVDFDVCDLRLTHESDFQRRSNIR